MTAGPSPFQKTKINRDFTKLNKLLYGFPKTGKTTFASVQRDSEGREPLFIATEDGHGALEVYRDRVTSWEQFLASKDKLVKNSDAIKKAHSCLVLDLISDLDQMCSDYLCARAKVRHISDLGDFGKGFAIQAAEFQGAIRPLFDILPITFIAHSADKEIQWNGEKVKSQSPSLSKRCMEYVNGKVDAIMWIAPANSKKEYPEITMRNTTTSIAGCRFRQLNRAFRYYPEAPDRTFQDMQKIFAGEEVANG